MCPERRGVPLPTSHLTAVAGKARGEHSTEMAVIGDDARTVEHERLQFLPMDDILVHNPNGSFGCLLLLVLGIIGRHVDITSRLDSAHAEIRAVSAAFRVPRIPGRRTYPRAELYPPTADSIAVGVVNHQLDRIL